MPDALAPLLSAIDEATERGAGQTARRLLRRGESLVQSALDQALLDVRWAFVPGAAAHVADAALDKALAVLAEHRQHGELARAYGAVGSLRMDREDPAGACEAYLRAEESFALLGDPSGILRSRLNRGAALMSAGSLREAAALLDQVEEDAQRWYLPDRDLIRALAATNLAAAALSLRQTARANMVLRRARRIYRDLGMPLRAATAVFNQAFQAARQGSFELALTRYSEAEELFGQGGDQTSAMMSRRGQGAMLAELGRSDDAAVMYREALQYFDRAGLLREALRTARGLAALSADTDPARAMALISERLTISVRSDPASQPDVAEALRNLAGLASAAGRHAEARQAYRDAAEVWRDLDRPADAAQLMVEEAVFADTLGHGEEAVRLCESALSAFAQAGVVSGLGLAHAKANMAVFLRHAAEQAGDAGADRRREALELALAAVAEVDTHRYGLVAADHRARMLDGRERTVYTTAVDAALQANDRDALTGVMEMARAHGVPDAAQQGPPGLSAWLHGMPFPLLRPDEQAGAGQPRQRAAQIRSYLQRLGGEEAWWITGWIDRRQITIATLGSATTAHRQPLDIDAYLALESCLGVTFPVDIENASRRPGALPHIVRYRAALGPLLADPEVASDSERWLSDGQRTAVRDHPAMVMASELGEAGLLWRLAQQVLPEALRAALLDRVAAGRRATLAVAPIGLIGHVPWALLPLREPADREDVSVPRVLDAAEVVYTPPLPFLLAADRSGPAADGSRLLVVADPLGDLPHARAHARPDATTLGGAWLGDPDRLATRARLLGALATDDAPTVLVIATHVDQPAPEHPADAAIVLAAPGGGEDPFTARSIYQEIQAAPPTCLLFGCESLGTTSAYEWTGLATALLWSGASQVTGALWPTLDDEAAIACERRLVDAMAADPAGGYSTYLTDAARSWRQDPGAPENRPYRWAGYGLVRGYPA